MYLQNDLRTTLNGVISGAGTFVKRFGSELFINADNSAGYVDGTVISGGGGVIFGSLEGNQVTLSNTAKLGSGHVYVNAGAYLQINDAGNLVSGQQIMVGSSLNDYGVLRLAADLTLDQIGFRAAGLGGLQDARSHGTLYAQSNALLNSNPSTGVLALNTVYTKPLDMRTLGDGTWRLGSTTNGVGANGAYDASSLLPGFNQTYYLAGGGSTLFVGAKWTNQCPERRRRFCFQQSYRRGTNVRPK